MATVTVHPLVPALSAQYPGQSIPLPFLWPPQMLSTSATPDPLPRHPQEEANEGVEDSELLVAREVELPLIDFGNIMREKDDARRKKLGEAMATAASEWGFMQLENHGVAMELIKRVERVAHRLFELPLERKERATPEDEVSSFGYRAGGAPQWRKAKSLTWQENFHFKRDPKMQDLKRYAEKIWPETNGDDKLAIEEFMSAVWEYSGAVAALADDITAVLTDDLGLPADSVTKLCGDGAGIAQSNNNEKQETLSSFRLNYYPPCSEPGRVLGTAAHSDPVVLTVLYQDMVGGLQIKKNGVDGDWVRVKPRPGSFIVNIGDSFQILSDRKYRSVEHRVTVNPTSARLSLVYFMSLREDSPFEPLPGLKLSAESPAAEKNTLTYAQYRAQVFARRRNGLSSYNQYKVVTIS